MYSYKNYVTIGHVDGVWRARGCQRLPMPQSLLEQLPEIAANGRKQAERILESLESRSRVCLQSR